MRKLQLISVALLLGIFHSVSPAQYIIKGKVFENTGNPVRNGKIVWVSNWDIFPRRIISIFVIKEDGTFEVDTKTKGLFRLWFCGLGQKSFNIPFYLEKPDTTIVNVRLMRLCSDTVKSITLLAGYDSLTHKYALKDKISLNGTEIIKREYKLPVKDFVYDLREGDTDNYIAGTKSDEYKFDTGKNFEERYNYYYSNVIKNVIDSTIHFEFDPKILSVTQGNEKYEFERADKKTLTFLKMNTAVRNAYNRYSKTAREIYAKYGQDHDRVNAYNWNSDMDSLENKIENSEDEFEKNCLRVGRIAIAGWDAFGKKEMKLSKDFAQATLNNIPPDSPLWSYFSEAMVISLIKASNESKQPEKKKSGIIEISGMNNPYLNYALSAFNSHPDKSMRTSLYRAVLTAAKISGRIDFISEFLDKFKKEINDTLQHKFLLSKFSPNRSIQKGRKVPDFNFESVNNPARTVSRQIMLGKKYLIHIWADWCGPCRTEIEAVRNINNRFSGIGFEVLSVSICFTEDNMKEFQKTHPMNWFCTHIDMKNDTKNFMKDFEVTSIPKHILVDEKGMIIETNELGRILEILSGK